MSLVIPNTLGSRTTSIQLSDLDENFEYFRDELNPYVNAISIGVSNAVTLNGALSVTGNSSVTGNVLINTLTTPSTYTPKLTVNAGSLGTTAGNTRDMAVFYNTNSNANYLRLFQLRNTTGSDWTTSTTRLQIVTDVTPQAYIDFNPPSGNYGIAFGTGTTLTERLRIDVNGTVSLASGSGLSISATGVTSPAATDGNVFSGIYTPIQVSTNTNVGAVTFVDCQYMRVGLAVTVSGQITITATTAATDTIVKMSLPIASNFSSSRQLAGVGSSVTTPYAVNNIAIMADATNDCVELRLRPSVNTALNYNFSFTYRIT